MQHEKSIKKLTGPTGIRGRDYRSKKSGMIVPRPDLEKAINFWSCLLKLKFKAFLTKNYNKKLHKVYKKNQNKIFINISALFIHSCWNWSNKVWAKKTGHTQKLPINKNSTIFVQSSWKLAKMIASWGH